MILSGGNVGAARFAELVSSAQQTAEVDLEERLLRRRDVGLAGGQPVEHPGGEQLVDAAVDDRRRDARVDVLAELAALDAALDDALDEVDRLRELADPLRELRAAAELLDRRRGRRRAGAATCGG